MQNVPRASPEEYEEVPAKVRFVSTADEQSGLKEGVYAVSVHTSQCGEPDAAEACVPL